MRAAWLSILRCPVTGGAYDLDVSREAGPGRIQEGFLVARGGREVRLVLAGLAVLPRDLKAHLRAFGNVYDRMPMFDSRVVRFVLGATGHGQYDHVPFEDVVGRYADLLPPGVVPTPPTMAPEDAALARLLAEVGPSEALPGLDVGCGVGRGTFLLREVCPRVLGLDRSLARARRARNISETRADFFLPRVGDTDTGSAPLELDRLSRDGVDFAVADPDGLPLVDGAFGVVVLRARDGLGTLARWDDAAAEATRVLAPQGILVLSDAAEAPPEDWGRIAEAAPFTAWKRR